MKKLPTIIQWAMVLWCVFCAFRMTQHERDMYKASYEIQKQYIEVMEAN